MEKKLNIKEMQMFVRRINGTDEGYVNFLLKVTLTFGFRFSTVSKLFDIPEEEVGRFLRQNYNNPRITMDAKKEMEAKRNIMTLDNLHSYGKKNQEAAESEYFDFINMLYQAYMEKDRAKVIELIGFINDIPFVKFKQNHEKGIPLNVDEALALIRYQVKYFIPTVQLCTKIGLTNAEFLEAVKLVKKNNQVLYDCYQNLIKETTRGEKIKEQEAKRNSIKISVNGIHRKG